MHLQGAVPALVVNSSTAPAGKQCADAVCTAAIARFEGAQLLPTSPGLHHCIVSIDRLQVCITCPMQYSHGTKHSSSGASSSWTLLNVLLTQHMLPRCCASALQQANCAPDGAVDWCHVICTTVASCATAAGPKPSCCVL